jgi:hypothetical protein
MLKLDTATYLATQDNPGGPIARLVEDDVEPMLPITDVHGKVSRASAAAYLVAYVLMAGLLGYLFLAL